jgi:protein involved in polysaccharide export with SLBB domain
VTDADYRVGAGDVLTIDRVGEKGPEELAVGRDGSIQLTGTDIRVDGMNAQEISTVLRRELGWEYQNCHVEISQPNSQFLQLFVDGKSAQAIPYRGKETVEEMLTRSDCPSCRRGYRVRVVRPGKAIGQLPEIFAFQIDSELKDRPTGREPVLLEPNDYVYLERDRGRPGELTKMTESRWYQKPGQWARQLRQQTQHDGAMAQRQ